jgi:hypothetical protein
MQTLCRHCKYDCSDSSAACPECGKSYTWSLCNHHEYAEAMNVIYRCMLVAFWTNLLLIVSIVIMHRTMSITASRIALQFSLLTIAVPPIAIIGFLYVHCAPLLYRIFSATIAALSALFASLHLCLVVLSVSSFQTTVISSYITIPLLNLCWSVAQTITVVQIKKISHAARGHTRSLNAILFASLVSILMCSIDVLLKYTVPDSLHRSIPRDYRGFLFLTLLGLYWPLYRMYKSVVCDTKQMGDD